MPDLKQNITGNIAFDVVTYAIVSTFVFLRFYVRYVLQRGGIRTPVLILGDLFAITAWCAVTINCVLDMYGCFFALHALNSGQILIPGLDTPAVFAARKLKYFYVEGGILYPISIWCVKGHFFCTYLAVASRLPRKIRYFIITAAVSTGAVYIGDLIFVLSWCRPMTRIWSLGVDNCSPLLTKEWSIYNTTVHLFTDILGYFTLLLLLMFLWTLPKLRLVLVSGLLVVNTIRLSGKREFYAVVLVVGLALSTMLLTIIRLTIQMSLLRTFDITKPDEDVAAFVRQIWYTGYSEQAGTVIVMCLPSFRSWLTHGQKQRDKGTPTPFASFSLSRIKGSAPSKAFGSKVETTVLRSNDSTSNLRAGGDDLDHDEIGRPSARRNCN